LGVTVIPVGLNYTAPLEFRSEVLLNVGTPVLAKDYQEKYEANSFQAAKTLTNDLQEQMKSLIFHTEEDSLDQLLSQIQTVLQSDQKLPPKDHFIRSQNVLTKLKALKDSDLDTLKKTANTYFQSLENMNLQDLSFLKAVKKNSTFPDILKLFFGLPFFIYGWVNNFLAFFIPGFIASKLKIFHGYIPTVKVLAGLIFLPLFFYIQTKLVSRYIDFPYIGWIYFLSLLPMGWVAWQYRKVALQFFQDRKAKRVQHKSSKQFEELISRRKELKTKIEAL